jgi:2,4-dienoyl-CoA reductase-like NADH-dependent reductase (Old Yellow Enzyme family)
MNEHVKRIPGGFRLNMTRLFTPITLRSVTLPNRVVVSPMCQYSAENGAANEWHFIHLGNLALSGAGMLCGRITPSGRATRCHSRRQ